jgi:alkylation response protein AidB-like acyl-CoA dehydrogenase
MFIVDLRAPGIEVRPIKQINGGSDFCEEFMTDVVVPASNLLGAENDGWSVLRGLLSIEHEWVGRSGGYRPAPVGVGELVALVEQRGLLGDDGVRRSVADLLTAQTVQRVLTQRVNRGVESGVFDAAYGGILKLGNDVVRQRRHELLLSLSGTRGIAWRPGDDRHETAGEYLRSRSASIAGGSSEIQRNNVSERALQLPREPSADRDLPFRQVAKN